MAIIELSMLWSALLQLSQVNHVQRPHLTMPSHYSMIVALSSLLLAAAEVGSVVARASGSAAVHVDENVGAATQLASGFIYGFPDNGIEASPKIPDHYLTDIAFRATRAGGAQIASPGWATGGHQGYLGRFNSTLSNYRTAQKYDAQFQLLVHDLWGADGGASQQFPFPGDNGNWTEMETFLGQLVADLKQYNMLDNLVIDIWNEPDGQGFWHRSFDQYIEYFARAAHVFKAALPQTDISGPSMANSPNENNDRWRAWCRYVADNDAIPDIYSWHQIGNWERQPDATVPVMDKFKSTYGLPDRPISVNEYATRDEQNPANSVYYISQLERWNLLGLRSNWGGGGQLHDFAANLLGRDSKGTYFPNGEWHVYKYYANMVGDRLRTEASKDSLFDVFAVKDGDVVRVLAGTRTSTNAYDIVIDGLGADGTLDVRTSRFDWTGPNGQIGGLVDLGNSTHTVNGGSFTIKVTPATKATAYAFEFGI
ncbi:glycoside hydrolase superfamily [Astrocystis sublimbata]|nr:glycoside hydrolase superfamily [Astrocystis sublimbata]